MIPAAFEYVAPTSVEEAVRLLRSHGDDAKLLAGGHSLIPLMKLRLASPKYLIDIGRIPGLAYIREDGDAIAIGALTTHSDIEHSELLRARVPVLSEAAARIGDAQVRNRGTIGGNLAHADPGADLPAAILAPHAGIMAQGSSGRRTIRASEFFVDMLTTALQPDEMLIEVRILPLPPRTGTVYLKAPHKASFYAVVGVAAFVTLAQDGACAVARVGVTGLAAKPFRAQAVEAALAGVRLDDATVQAAAQRVDEGVEPLSDIYASAEYRAHLARVYTANAIRQAAARASGGGA